MHPALIRLCFCLALLGMNTAHAMKASDVAPCRPNMPQEVRTLPGLFTVHVACDHVLFEVPPEMILAACAEPLYQASHITASSAGYVYA